MKYLKPIAASCRSGLSLVVLFSEKMGFREKHFGDPTDHADWGMFELIPAIFQRIYTGALRPRPPLKLSKKFSTAGILSISPMTGVPLMDSAAMGKNWPKR